MNWNTYSINNSNNNDIINAVIKRKNKTEFGKETKDHKDVPQCRINSFILEKFKIELLLTTSINEVK